MASEADLNEEIDDLKARGNSILPTLTTNTTHTNNTPQVDTLNAQLRVQLNGLLTTPSARDAIHKDAASTSTSSSSTAPTTPLQARLDRQLAHAQQSTYRICAGITTFRVRNPDPNAVDHGAVLGLRIEVMTRARFARPYFVFLNRPYTPTSSFFRVHRHTVPPCIPLNGLASRYLPAPAPKRKEDHDGGDGRKAPPPRAVQQQDLPRFARALRREIVRYHNRVAVVADLRKVLGLDGKRRDAVERAERCPIYAIGAADAESKHIRVDWKDGRAGRLVLGDDGEVCKAVVLGEMGRDREVTRELLGGGERLEDVARRLAAV